METFHTDGINIKSLLNSYNFHIKSVEKEVNTFFSFKFKIVKKNEVKERVSFSLYNRLTEHYRKQGKIPKDIIYIHLYSNNEN